MNGTVPATTLPSITPGPDVWRSGEWTSRLIPSAALLSVGVVALVALLGPFFIPTDAVSQHLSATLLPPGPGHLLGTDYLGRDVLALTMIGGRTALLGPLVIAFGVTLIGNTLGITAGYFGGWIDAAVMRGVDLVYALPGLLVAIVAVGVLGGSYLVALLALIFLFSPADARIIRGNVLVQRSMPYVESARIIGLSHLRIMVVHILPNMLNITLAQAFLTFPVALVVLSSLSYLGLGTPPGSPDWGRAMAEGKAYLFDNAFSVLAPGAMIALTATSTNLLGDWLQERLNERGRS
jgi:peptide/nickel transport system permease protein